MGFTQLNPLLNRGIAKRLFNRVKKPQVANNRSQAIQNLKQRDAVDLRKDGKAAKIKKMKKVIISLSIIAAAAAIAVGATTAFFSDTETSTGNTFTAGSIDLTVDNTQHYNGNVCVKADTTEPTYIWKGNAAYPVPGTSCDGTWAATDLGVEKFFNYADVKPGEIGRAHV